MIIDSPIISGSAAASGSLNQLGNITITGSLTVTGAIIGAVTGSVNSASYAANAELLDGLDSTVFTLTSSFAAQTASFTAFTASINAQTASLLSFTASTILTDATQSARLSGLEAASASINSYTSSNDAKIVSIYSTTSSLNASVASLNSYTQSNDAKIVSIYATTASLNAFSASVLSYTSSQNITNGTFTTTASFNAQTASFTAFTSSINAFSASILSYTSSQNILNGTYTLTSSFNAQTASFTAFTASLNSFSASINSFSSSILTFTGSAATRLGALEAATASLYTATSSLNASVASLNSYTQSTDAKIASIYSTTSSLNTRVGTLEAYTSSLNAKTSSFATTGSNTFVGIQTITGSLLQSGSFTSTGTLTAQTLVVQTITSSVIYSSGSNIFGNAIGNTQIFTGSLYQTGSLASFAGNVGIGTTSPTTKLVVQGGASFRGGTNVTQANYNDSGSTVDIIVDNQQPKIISSYWSGTEKNLYLGTYSQQSLLVLTTGGNVGIGSTSPAYKLDVNGSIKTQATGAGTGILLHTNTGWTINSNLAQFWTGQTSGFAFQLNSTGDGTNEKVRIDGSGNVGIGTTNPTGSLHVRSSDGTVRFASSTGNDAGRIILMEGALDAWSMDGGLANGTFLIRDEYNSSTRLAINNVGNVGIGTTSPSGKLDIWGLNDYNQLWIRATTGNAAINFDVETSASSYYNWRIDAQGLVGNAICITPSTAAGGTTFTSPVMTITQGGNVGIGTTSPAAKLNVIGNIRASGNAGQLDLDINVGALRFYDGSTFRGGFGTDEWATAGSSANLITYLNGGNYHIYSTTTASKIFTALSGGNVGIGTTNPAYKLDVVGSFSFTTGGNYLQYASGILYHGNYYQYPSGDNYLLFARTSGALLFGSNDTERMRITSAGTVQPGANGTQDLGTSSLRWSTVYTSDLSLSNGIGDYTIVEGENDLFLYNNKQNKVYKFMLAEVDPTDATPKKS